MSSALNIMAWREILARTMQGFTVESGVSPDWLVNPATKRRLKLDLLYPQAGLAVRFVGLTAKGQPKQSDWELLEEAQRDLTREELCRQHGIELFLLDPDYPHPGEQLQRLRTILSRLDDIARRVKSPENLALFAELWRDRETAAVVAAARPPAPWTSTTSARPLQLAEGQRVRHTRFGPGVVETITAAGDPQITILFDSGERRTFVTSLVVDKLQAL